MKFNLLYFTVQGTLVFFIIASLVGLGYTLARDKPTHAQQIEDAAEDGVALENTVVMLVVMVVTHSIYLLHRRLAPELATQCNLAASGQRWERLSSQMKQQASPFFTGGKGSPPR